MTKVYAIRVYCYSHIHAVIDKEFCLERSRKSPKFPRKRQQILNQQILFPNLDRPHPAFERQANCFGKRQFRLFTVRYQVKLEINCQGNPQIRSESS
jgi:hypothetical protein